MRVFCCVFFMRCTIHKVVVYLVYMKKMFSVTVVSFGILFLFSDLVLARTTYNSVRSQRCVGGAGHNCGAATADILCRAIISWNTPVPPGSTTTVTSMTNVDPDLGVGGSIFSCDLGETTGFISNNPIVTANGIGLFVGLPRSFMAPTAPGTYPLGFSHIFTRSEGTVRFFGDSQTNSDFIVSTPTPTLNLSGSTAFLNLFTKAVAQEVKQENDVIADVNLLNQKIISREDRLFTLSLSLQSLIGTQTGVLYGVQVFNKDTNKLVDQFALNTPLTLIQNEIQTKEFIYALPANITGNLDFYVYAHTDKGVLLGAGYLDTIAFKDSTVTVALSPCTITGNTLACTITNTTKAPQTVIVGTEVKAGVSSFAPTLAPLPNQTITLKASEKKTYTQTLPAYTTDAFFETFIAQNFQLQARITNTLIASVRPQTINNVLIDQTSATNYSVKAVTLNARATTDLSLRTTLFSIEGMCESATVPQEGVTTTTNFTLKKACDVVSIKTELMRGDTVLDTNTVPHMNLFPKQPFAITGWMWALLGFVIVGLIALVATRHKRE